MLPGLFGILLALLNHVARAQQPCVEVDAQLDFPCMCIRSGSPYSNVKINCDNVAFPKDFPLLPFQMNITEYRQRHAGIQSLTGQLFTSSELPLQKVDFSRNMIRSISQGVWEGLEDVMEELSLRHNLLGDTYNVLAGSYNTKQASTEIAKLTTLKILDLGYNNIRKLDDNLFSKLMRIQILRLDGNAFQKIPTKLFTGLDNVKLLTLENNDISAVHEDAFMSTPSLEALDLSGNRISNVADGAFVSLTELSTLDMSRNKLTELSAGVFDGLGRLHHVDLSNNFLVEVPADALKKLKNIKHLDLKANHIQNLGGIVALGPLKSLEILSLSRNNLGELTQGTFQELPGLKKLDLAVNSIRKVEINAFDGLTSLEILHLDDNNILSIPGSALEKVSTIQTLTLNYNRIRVISSENLKSVTMLNKLSLTHNIIQEIPNGTFAEFGKLKELNLYGNKLQNILAESFTGLRDSLEVLDLGSNILEELPQFDFPKMKKLVLAENNIDNLPEDAFLRLPELQSLDLQKNYLSALPTTLLYPLSKLATIDLSHNRIEKLNNGQFNESIINVINLQHNAITEIPTNAFQNLLLIHTIDLSHNKIKLIQDGAFYNTPFLHILRLNSNMLSSFKKDFFMLPQDFQNTGLRILDLSNNDITFIESEALSLHPQIIWINLSHNRLTFLPYLFVRSAFNLKHLDVSYNMIEKLEAEDFSNSTYLRELMLNNNLIKDIKETAFQYSTQLQELNLANNMISQLPENIFLGLSRLSLDLSYNQLNELPIDVFHRTKLQKLISLNLAHNQFKSIPVQALKKQSFYLSDLDMSHNEISDVPNSADILINAKSLDLSFNPLKEQDIIVLLNEPKLMGRINLSGTGITDVPVIESPFLLSLNLSHNKIVELREASFSKTQNIRMLDVSHNQIPNLSYGLATAWPKMGDLRSLDISHNPIAYIIRGDFNYLDNLEVLKASNLPRVTRIDSTALQPLHALKELHLHTLPLATFHTKDVLETVPGLEIVDIDLTERVAHDHLHPSFSPRLKSLIVRGKSLHSLSGGAFAGINSPELEIGLVNTSVSNLINNVFIPVPMSSKITLNVDESQIATLDKSFLNSIDSRQHHIKLTGLSSNPIFCDCNSKSLQEWILQLDNLDPIQNITCSAPADLAGKQLMKINPNDLTCKGRPTTTTTETPSFTTSSPKKDRSDNIITSDTIDKQHSDKKDKNSKASRAGALTNMDTLIIGVVGGVVAFVALLIIIICLLKLRSDSQYKGGPLAAPCTCVKPPPPNWGYPGPGPYPTLPHAHHSSRPSTLKVMPSSTPVPPAYGTVGGHSSRSYYSGQPYYVPYPQESENDHR